MRRKDMNQYRYRLLAAVAAVLLMPLSLLAQQNRYLQQVEVQGLRVQKAGNSVKVDMQVVLDGLRLATDDVLLITPTVRSADGQQMAFLPQIQVVGRTRGIIMERNNATTVADNANATIQESLVRKNKTAQSVNYSATVPFEAWMNGAELMLVEQVYGCSDCFKTESAKALRSHFIIEPNLQLSLVEPGVEPVKARADRHTATIYFKVARHELVPTFESNGTVLAKVDEVMQNIVNNKDVKVTELAVRGYASPEASVSYNKALAERRANSVVEYLVSKYGLAESQLRVEGVGEDWQRTREVIAASTIADKEEILNIIDTVADPDERDHHLRQLSGGSTYQTMLHNYYPQIRRTEYQVAYNVKPFSVEEAREMMQKDPKLLSLNEMYLVAQSYPAGSKERNNALAVAATLFPNEPAAIINASTASIEAGNYQSAIDQLSKLSNEPAAWNNTAVALYHKGDVATARKLLEQAAAKGNAQAKHNLAELNKAEAGK